MILKENTMKIRDVLIESLRSDDHPAAHSANIRTFTFTWFSIALAALYAGNAVNLLTEDMSEISGRQVGGCGTNGAKAIPQEEIKAENLLEVLTGADGIRFTSLSQNAMLFLKWFLEQEAPKKSESSDMPADRGMTWLDAEYIADMWNLYLSTNFRA